jgi:hypothetical protein
MKTLGQLTLKVTIKLLILIDRTAVEVRGVLLHEMLAPSLTGKDDGQHRRRPGPPAAHVTGGRHGELT